MIEPSVVKFNRMLAMQRRLFDSGRVIGRGMAAAAPVAAGMALGAVAGWVGYLGLYYARMMILSERQPLGATPADYGLPAEEVAFPSQDGVLLRGWFLLRAGDPDTPAPVVVLVHGWPWNRLGNRAGTALWPDRTVRLIEPARALHAAGLHVLMFDLRNHGLSDAAPPVTFGVHEARDLLGALRMLRARLDVDSERIGVLGYSMGANATMYALPDAQPVRAAMLVQPVRATTFAEQLAIGVHGSVGALLSHLAGPIHQLAGAPPLQAIDPTLVAPQLGPTRVWYIQGSDDPWGSVAEVQAMAAATPNALPVTLVAAQDRYEGYLFVERNLAAVVAFFQENLA